MKKKGQIEVFDSYDQADRATKQEWLEMGPRSRLNLLEELRKQRYGKDQPSPRLQRFFEVVDSEES